MSKPEINWGRLGWRLRTAMHESRASYRDMERITGIDHSTLLRISQDREVRAEAMLAVCDILDIDPMSLFTSAEVVLEQ